MGALEASLYLTISFIPLLSPLVGIPTFIIGKLLKNKTKHYKILIIISKICLILFILDCLLFLIAVMVGIGPGPGDTK